MPLVGGVLADVLTLSIPVAEPFAGIVNESASSPCELSANIPSPEGCGEAEGLQGTLPLKPLIDVSVKL